MTRKHQLYKLLRFFKNYYYCRIKISLHGMRKAHSLLVLFCCDFHTGFRKICNKTNNKLDAKLNIHKRKIVA